MLIDPTLFTVRRAVYCQPSDPLQSDTDSVLKVSFEEDDVYDELRSSDATEAADGFTVDPIEIPNCCYGQHNAALKFMAYCGVKPSTLDEIEGCSVEMVPFRDGWTPHQRVWSMGTSTLEMSSWCMEE